MSTSTILGFDDLGDRVIAQQLQEDAAGAATLARPPSVPLAEWYELDRTTAAIKAGGYKRVALQFPDRLLPEAGEVATQLGDRLKSSGARTFVLGDTSFGSCCVDEVAAAVRATVPPARPRRRHAVLLLCRVLRCAAVECGAPLTTYLPACRAFCPGCLACVCVCHSVQHLNADFIVHYGHSCLRCVRVYARHHCRGRPAAGAP